MLTRSTLPFSSAKANLASAQSSLNYQAANMERYKTLYKKGLVSADEYENALLTYRQAKEQVASSKENVQRAQTNLGYATITSPIDGTVISKSVEEGQTVAASFNTPELFTIAKDLTNMQVVANVDEADIGNVKEGDRVTFTVDAYPDDTFEGTVKQVRLEATTTNNVVTYEVVISAPNADLKLKPGLTANVTIYTQERSGVLAVANKALRFTPTKETVGKDMKIVDSKGKNKVWTLNGNTLTAHPVTIDSPLQGAKGIPAEKTVKEDGTIKVTIGKIGASFEGKMADDEKGNLKAKLKPTKSTTTKAKDADLDFDVFVE